MKRIADMYKSAARQKKNNPIFAIQYIFALLKQKQVSEPSI